MDLTAIMEWLLTENYVIVHKGKPKFTSTFHKIYSGIEQGLTKSGIVLEPNLPAVLDVLTPTVIVPAELNVYKYQDWVNFYMKFIIEAQIPRRCSGRSGDPYDTNKYSEDGMKAFQKAIKEGVLYDLLVKSTMLYYKGGNQYKKAVGNYMSQGDWRTDYQQLAQSAINGAEAISDHIRQETKSSHNVYRR